MLISHLNRSLLEADAADLRRVRRSVTGPCAPKQSLADGRSVLSFCSNDYLGLANHPLLVQALADGAQRWGAGSGASHLVSGHSLAHAALEERLARVFSAHIPQAEVLLFCSGYMANLGLLTALGELPATLFSDKLNHASLVDGMRLARATHQRYPHGDLDRLDRLLGACTSPIKLVSTDTVFSMDGNLADLPRLLALAERHDAWLLLDDAHGFGVLGAQGHGSLEHFGLCSERLICMGTLGKAAGLAGAFVAAHPSVVAWLVQKARSYIYTTAMPPAQAHALQTSLDLIEGPEGQQRRRHLQALIAHWRAQAPSVLHRDWSLPASATPIQPVWIGSNAQALRVAAALEAQGLWVPAIRPPTVPQGTARLRVTFSAAHQMADLGCLLAALAGAAAQEEPA